ncbi:hypothetical protein Pfo_006085 [Paulownia fortunei]|nr:hypothetical protein Pfo_006085 [Paulownia fortunei]
MPKNDVIIAKNVKESATDPTADKTPAAAAAAAPKPPINADKKKKKSGAFGIFRAALFMLRKKPGEKGTKKTITKQNSTASKANWTKLVGSMRPLSLQETDQSPPPQQQQPLATERIEEMIPPQKQPSAAERLEEMIPPASPAASSSCGTMSQYASAASLRDLYNSSDDEEDPDEVFDAICGDEMIDAKAEEFIAQFYKQMQLQKTAPTHHHHHHDRGI